MNRDELVEAIRHEMVETVPSLAGAQRIDGRWEHSDRADRAIIEFVITQVGRFQRLENLTDPSPMSTCRGLLEQALFLRQNGERPPGAPISDLNAETWGDWDRRAEEYLRSNDEVLGEEQPMRD